MGLVLRVSGIALMLWVGWSLFLSSEDDVPESPVRPIHLALALLGMAIFTIGTALGD